MSHLLSLLVVQSFYDDVEFARKLHAALDSREKKKKLRKLDLLLMCPALSLWVAHSGHIMSSARASNHECELL